MNEEAWHLYLDSQPDGCFLPARLTIGDLGNEHLGANTFVTMFAGPKRSRHLSALGQNIDKREGRLSSREFFVSPNVDDSLAKTEHDPEFNLIIRRLPPTVATS